jgi:hypothetical protein
VLLEWLMQNGVPQLDKNKRELSVADNVRLATSINPRNIIIPPWQHSATESMLVRRRNISEYYNTLPNPDPDTIESTRSHQYINESLAEVYRLLFPTGVPEQERVDTANEKVDDTAPPNNHFELLVNYIEKKPTFQFQEAKFVRVAPKQSKTFIIADDTMEKDPLFHSFVKRLESIVLTTRDFWRENAATPVIAATMTHFALTYIRTTFDDIGSNLGNYEHFSIAVSEEKRGKEKKENAAKEIAAKEHAAKDHAEKEHAAKKQAAKEKRNAKRNAKRKTSRKAKAEAKAAKQGSWLLQYSDTEESDRKYSGTDSEEAETKTSQKQRVEQRVVGLMLQQQRRPSTTLNTILCMKMLFLLSGLQ